MIDQTELWNGPAGRAWVEAQEVLDGMFRPFEEGLSGEAAAAGAWRVLDVGCGTGAVTRAVARRTGGAALGVDVSAPMLAAARERARREGSAAEFLEANAEFHEFGAGSFDRIVSRFGVMFFAEPGRAFANLRRAAAPGAELDCLAWRSAGENPFMTAAERAAGGLLALPPRDPEGPGQFAFGNRERVRGILAAGGWGEIAVEAQDEECSLAEAELATYLTRLGPVGMALREVAPETRARVLDALREAFAPFVADGVARYTAACWRVRARA